MQVPSGNVWGEKINMQLHVHAGGAFCGHGCSAGTGICTSTLWLTFYYSYLLLIIYYYNLSHTTYNL